MVKIYINIGGQGIGKSEATKNITNKLRGYN
jgi:hypothetical protein